MKLTPGVDFPEFRRVNAFVKRNNDEGIYVDNVKLQARISNLREKRDKILENIEEVGGEGFLPGSPAQVQRVLLDELGIPEDMLMYHNKLSTNKKVLEKISEKYDIPFVDDIMAYRKVNGDLSALTPAKKNKNSKALNQYTRPSERVDDEGRALEKVTPKLGLANTSRYQYSEPNLVGMTSDVSDVLCAPEGYYMIWIDVKQQEPSIFFEGVLRCEPIKKLFRKGGNDRYLTIAKFCTYQDHMLDKIEDFVTSKGITKLTEDDWVYPFLVKIPGSTRVAISQRLLNSEDDINNPTIPVRSFYEIDYAELNDYISDSDLGDLEISDVQRDRYKTAIISGGYGASKGTLITLAGYEVGCSMHHMLETLPEMVEYKEKTHRYIGANGNQVRTVFNTILPLEDHDKKTGNPHSRAKMTRLALNYPTQGTGADLLKFAIMGVEDWKSEMGYTDSDLRMAFTKHDEHVFYAKKSLEGVMTKLIDIISVEVDDWAPIGVEASYGTHYGVPIEGEWGK